MVDKSRYYIDVNVFVYWLGNHPKYGQEAVNWIKKWKSRREESLLPQL